MALRSITLSTAEAQILVETDFDESIAVTTVYFCNKSPTACTINVYAVSAQAIAGPTNVIYNSLAIAGNDTYVMEAEKLILFNGDLIAANVSANSSVVATVSYVGI
jgi:hypothetical protein